MHSFFLRGGQYPLHNLRMVPLPPSPPPNQSKILTQRPTTRQDYYYLPVSSKTSSFLWLNCSLNLLQYQNLFPFKKGYITDFPSHSHLFSVFIVLFNARDHSDFRYYPPNCCYWLAWGFCDRSFELVSDNVLFVFWAFGFWFQFLHYETCRLPCRPTLCR